jgi:anthranilate phosphoribosyltransferase
MNTAAALIVAGVVTDLAAGVRLAAEAIDTGKARKVLDHLVQVTNTLGDKA